MQTRLAGLFSCAYPGRRRRAPTPRAPAHRGAHHESTASSLTSLTLALCATRALHDHCRTMRRWSAGEARGLSNIRSTAAPRAHDVHAAAHSVAARPPVLPLTRSPPRRTVIAGSATTPAACHTPSHRSAACAAQQVRAPLATRRPRRSARRRRRHPRGREGREGGETDCRARAPQYQ